VSPAAGRPPSRRLVAGRGVLSYGEAPYTEVLTRYARTHGANGAGWDFPDGVAGRDREGGAGYGVVARKIERGTVDHALVTTIVDQRGIMRVQYLGTRFDPEEFLRDIRGLLDEARS
jgi:protein SCO1